MEAKFSIDKLIGFSITYHTMLISKGSCENVNGDVRVGGGGHSLGRGVRVWAVASESGQWRCSALWARIIKKSDVSTGPLACPFTCTAHSFARSALLAHSASSLTSLTSELVGKL